MNGIADLAGLARLAGGDRPNQPQASYDGDGALD